MSYELTPEKLGYKINDVLVGLKSGTTDTPETLASTQNKLHTIGYVWNPDTLAFELPTKVQQIDLVSAAPAVLTDFAGRAEFNTIFGEKVIGSRIDDISVMFQYNNSTRDVVTGVTGSGVIGNTKAMGTASITTTAGTAFIRSADSVRYRPGHEAVGMFTTVYTGAQAGVEHEHGLINDICGVAFGTDDGVFGIWLTEESTRTFIPQSSFNVDKIDGTGASGFDIEPSAMNIYCIQYGWLGIAPILFSVYGGYSRGWIVCHAHDRVNIDAEPHLDNPALPILARVTRASGTGTAASIKTGSWRAGVVSADSEDNSSNRWFAATVLDASITGSGTRNNVLTLSVASTFQSKPSHVDIDVGVVTFDNSGNKTLAIYATKNATISGGGTPAAVDATNSVVSTIAGGTITGGERIASTVLKSGADRRSEVRNTGLIAKPGETITFEFVASTAFTGTVSIALRWIERF